MKETDSFDILLSYPKSLGIKYETHESQQRFFLNPGDPFLKTKFVVFKKDELFFCAYDSYAAQAYSTNTFTGMYGAINLPANFECKIHNKDFLDPFLRMNKRKSGEKAIDDFLTITTRSNYIPENILSGKDVTLYQKINRVISPISLVIQNDYRPIIKELNGKKVIGLETKQWIYKKEDLEALINLGSELVSHIIQSRG